MITLSVLIKGLTHISETDAGFTLIKGKTLPLGRTVILNFHSFFAFKTQVKEHYDLPELHQVEKYVELRDWLRTNLSDIIIAKIYTSETEYSLYIYGVNKDKKVVGIQTKGVET